MPSATPLPAGPSHLALFGAEDLLRTDGCPVCRYVAGAAHPSPRRDICQACLMAYRLVRDALDDPGSPAAGPVRGGPSAGLCPAHLRDACAGPAAARLLATEAERSLAWLAAAASPPGALGRLAGRRRSQAGEAADGCTGCRAAGAAADQAFHALHAGLGQPDLCLHHVMALRRHDPSGAQAAVRSAADRTQALLAELEEAFRKRSWAHRHEPRGREMTAWQRAAALVDGRVYDAGPPR
jgi:hypothetical protein